LWAPLDVGRHERPILQSRKIYRPTELGATAVNHLQVRRELRDALVADVVGEHRIPHTDPDEAQYVILTGTIAFAANSLSKASFLHIKTRGSRTERAG